MTDGGEGTKDQYGDIGRKISVKLKGKAKSELHKSKIIINLIKGRDKKFYTNERKIK